ncbi:MAG: bifunctional UDP-sugar hydrolase/5'-nucleotidase [Bacteroidales bacterium]
MKKVLSVLVILLIFLSLQAQTGGKIVILHTNDMHSRLIGYSPESDYTPLTVNDDKTIGGFARIATILHNEEKTNPGNTMVVDAGDFLMGTLFQELEPSTGFELRLMKTMGYDVVCIGNHEFDFGDDKLAEMVSSAAKGGAIPALLLGNIVFDKKKSGDDAIEKLFSSGTMGKTYIMEKNGLKIGFFSLLGKVAVKNAAFAPPLKFSNQVRTARKLVRELKNEKCDIIICLSHSGVTLEKNGQWGGEDVELAKKVRGIDVLISGHTHTKLEKPIMVNGIPVVQAGEHGQYVGKLELTFDKGKVNVDNYSLLPVDDRTAGDPGINKLIEDQKKLVNDEILKPLGMDYSKPVVESSFLLECNEMGDLKGSNMGPLVADAIYSYLNKHTRNGIDVSMVAAGMICDKIIPGFQSAPDIFRIMMMGEGKDNVPGYPLSRIYITGKELKSVLEILQMASKSDPDNYCYYSGIRAEYNPDGGFLKKIKKIDIIDRDGKVKNVDFSKKNKTLYSVAANSYMLAFIGIIKKMSFGLVNVVPKDAAGKVITDMKEAVIDMDETKDGVQEGKEWLALMEYLSLMKDTNGNGIPDVSEKYRIAVQTFIPVKGQ